jgi:SAM-dependent methyltransferase
VDWNLGHYEQIAVGLLPAAETVVGRAAPLAGEHVVDIGCGSGNAALLAAARGARVTAVDPAERLLTVAQDRAAAVGADVTFIQGEAGQLPLGDGDADVVLSAFGVIFAPDPVAAAAEIARVTRPGGRIAISAWMRDGPMPEVGKIMREGLGAAGFAADAPPPFAWHEREAVARLFGPHGFALEFDEHMLALTSSSPDAFIDSEIRNHPVWATPRAVLEPSELRAVRERARALLESANEDAGSFRVSWRYLLTTGHSPGP